MCSLTAEQEKCLRLVLDGHSLAVLGQVSVYFFYFIYIKHFQHCAFNIDK